LTTAGLLDRLANHREVTMRGATMAARLPYLERADVPPEVQTVYDTVRKATGRVLNIFKLMAHHGRSLPPFLGWYPTLREGPLDRGLRQLAYVRASQLNGCGY
jgi:alkylhydroperoxidase family enzyme